MEVLSICVGVVFWPLMILGWLALNRHGRLRKVAFRIGLGVLITLPALAALSMAHWMFIDEPLYFAALESNVSEVRRLLKLGANPNVMFEGSTPAIVAAGENGNTEVVRILLRAGANVNARSDSHGPTAIGAANQNKHLDTALILRNAGGLE